MENTLRTWAASRGYQVACAPAAVLDLVRADLERRLEAGEIEADFASTNLAFEFPPAAGSWLRAVVVVAMPRPAHVIRFACSGRLVDAIMPPTYERYRRTFEDVRTDLGSALSAWRVEQLNVPLKALASRVGLVRYGRNNLAYAPHIGSYLQLLAYGTDAALVQAEGWAPAEPRLLDECQRCRACERACPTAAITRARVLLHAEHCLTLANETPGNWPAWVTASVHHCLIGCLRCQAACPANPPPQRIESGVTFGEEETQALLHEGRHEGPAWDAIRRHLEALGRPYSEAVLGRNLRALLETQADAGHPKESGRVEPC